MSKTFSIFTLGCRANQAQSFGLECQIIKCSAEGGSASGGQMIEFGEPADIYIINTCTVTADADRKSRKAVRQALKLAKKVIVTGCYARLKSKELKELFPDIEILDPQSMVPNSQFLAPRIRENLMIEDGCENFCSYCIVPYARGKVQVKQKDIVLNEAEALAGAGAREIVLTGINLGAWGELSPLINELSKIKELTRIRLSSIEPQYVSESLIKTIANNPKACRHLHIPLQSGDDRTLKLMNRIYNVAEYTELIDKIRKSIPDCGITTDVITGFPGEGEKEFRNTVETIEKIGFSRLHVFTYSKRDLTAAAKMPGQVDAGIKKERYAILNKLRARLMRTFAEKYIGKEVEILVESKGEGLTSNYIRVRFDDNGYNTGKLYQLILSEDKIVLN